MLFFSFQWFTLTDCTFKPTFFPILSPMYNNFLGNLCPFHHSSFVSCRGVWTCDCLHKKSQNGLCICDKCWQNILWLWLWSRPKVVWFDQVGELVCKSDMRTLVRRWFQESPFGSVWINLVSLVQPGYPFPPWLRPIYHTYIPICYGKSKMGAGLTKQRHYLEVVESLESTYRRWGLSVPTAMKLPTRHVSGSPR